MSCSSWGCCRPAEGLSATPKACPESMCIAPWRMVSTHFSSGPYQVLEESCSASWGSLESLCSQGIEWKHREAKPRRYLGGSFQTSREGECLWAEHFAGRQTASAKGDLASPSAPGSMESSLAAIIDKHPIYIYIYIL